MRSKSEGWVGISPTHLVMATVFRGSHQEVKEELFVPWNLKGNGVLAYPFKAFAKRAATE